MFDFTITATGTTCPARTGEFSTPHGVIHTPCFMPCGTKGSVKTLTPDELKTLGCEIILGNTFHLMLRPGGENIKRMGGLHKWISWNKPMLTDSGGFQVFSLSKIRKINDEGVTFQSPIDGSTHFLTPEKSMEIQEQLGADIIMAFDDCPPPNAEKEYIKQSMDRTHQWLLRSIKARTTQNQTLFPIIQGGAYSDLRIESAKFILQQNTSGIAIGGIAVGESKEEMWEAVDAVAPFLPKEKPHYLMGIGEPVDIVNAVSRGIDMFDCVIPTRLARHGSFWTHQGRFSILKNEFALDSNPLENDCKCYACANFSRSYLRHLMQEKEILGHRLLTIHNLHFLLNLMRDLQTAIAQKTLEKFSKNFISNFLSSDEKNNEKSE